MNDIIKRLKLNSFNLFVMLVLALFAAFTTVFFAVAEGVTSFSVIFSRALISFFVIAVCGYYFSGFLAEKIALYSLSLPDNGKVDEEKLDKTDELSQVEEDDLTEMANEKENDGSLENTDTEPFDDDSFNKVVILDKDDD